METPRPPGSRTTRLAMLGAVLLVSAAAPTAQWPALPRYEAMAVPADNPMTQPKVELGRQLFFDRRLSGDESVACASCHRPEHGFTDGVRGAVAAYGVRSGRSCPTLWNVGY